MPEKSIGLWIWISGGIATAVGGIVGIISKSTFVTKTHCKEKQDMCGKHVCDKIDQLREGQKDVMVNVADMNANLANLTGAFNQYLADQREKGK